MVLGAILGPLAAIWEPLGTFLGASWSLLGRLGRLGWTLRRSWEHLGGFWCVGAILVSPTPPVGMGRRRRGRFPTGLLCPLPRPWRKLGPQLVTTPNQHNSALKNDSRLGILCKSGQGRSCPRLTAGPWATHERHQHVQGRGDSLLEPLGVPWEVLGPLQCILGVSWGLLGTSWTDLEAIQT